VAAADKGQAPAAGLDFCSPIVHRIGMPFASRANTLGPADPHSPGHLAPGQLLARGVCRHLRGHDFVTIEEFTPERGKRLDILALGPKGEVWVIECKSSRADFASDAKWPGYLEWGDRYFWAVDERFPTDLLPAETGLIIADGYDAEILRMGLETRLAAPRRKAVIQRFARHAALRLQALRDPGLGV
jgi:hypothetical protein